MCWLPFYVYINVKNAECVETEYSMRDRIWVICDPFRCDQTLFCHRGGEGRMRWGLSWCTASAGKQRSCLSGEAGWVHHFLTFSPQGALTRKQAHERGNASIVPHLPSREDDFTFTPGSMTSFLPVSAIFRSLDPFCHLLPFLKICFHLGHSEQQQHSLLV